MATTTGQHPLTQTMRQSVFADLVAGTGTLDVIGVCPFAGHLTRASYFSDVAITGVATNFKTLQVQNRGQAGSGTTVMASYALSAGNNAPLADEIPLALSGTPANLDFAQGDVLALVTVVAGTGMTLPTGMIEVDLYRD